jgi:UDP-2,3-diacylglucosamine pyrophosphatase LpxH
MAVVQSTFVISDLHIGGAAPDSAHPHDRGFRLCTNVPLLAEFVNTLASRPHGQRRIELVINGDVVDFLVERSGTPPTWVDFISDGREAARTLEAIVAQNRDFFDALARYLDSDHRLVMLLGNHDLELSLPDVRRALARALKLKGRHDFQFIYDGEGYVVADALIEHGNRYDRWNVVDHSKLRELRAWQSRRQPNGDGAPDFAAPPGSRMVCEVINPIKAEYPFIDLLKPETETVLPLLLALEPRYCAHLRTAAWLSAAAWPHRLAGPARPRIAGDISSAGIREQLAMKSAGSDRAAQGDALTAVLERAMPGQAAGFLAAILHDGPDAAALHVQAGDISSFNQRFTRGAGLVRLFAAARHNDVERRLPALLQAFRVLQSDRTFDLTRENLPEYLESAQSLVRGGFRYVIFGHTHVKRDVRLDGNAHYLNSGTWADQIRFDADALGASDAEALQWLRGFVNDMSAGSLQKWLTRQSTYVRLDIEESGGGDERIVEHEVVDYRGGPIL